MKLWKVGLLTVIIGGLINAVLIQNEISGVFRELTRLVVLAGFVILAIGIIKPLSKRSTGK